MYERGPSDEELEAIGLCREDVVDTTPIEVWPENWLPLEVFRRMRTQWDCGMNGATGLRYPSIPLILKRVGVPKKQFAEVFDAVQILEYEALRCMAQKD